VLFILRQQLTIRSRSGSKDNNNDNDTDDDDDDDDGMLGQFHHLLVLDAAFSDLEWVEPELFNHLTRLETLHLEAGRMTVVENLSAMKNLRRIYLQQNHLTQVVTLAGLYSLVFVDFSYNRISHVPAFWLDGFRHLQVNFQVTTPSLKAIQVWLTTAIKPCCRKETARCRSCSFRFIVCGQKTKFNAKWPFEVIQGHVF